MDIVVGRCARRKRAVSSECKDTPECEMAKGGFFSERADAFVICQTNLIIQTMSNKDMKLLKMLKKGIGV